MNKWNNNSDIICDLFIVDNTNIKIIYNEVLTDSYKINKIIKYTLSFTKNELNRLDKYLPITNVLIINDKDINSYIDMGYIVIKINKCYAIETKNKLDRGINSVTRELSLGGAKDSFNESFNTNLGLIKKRISTYKLNCITKNIGKYSNTKVGLLYIDGITRKSLLKDIITKINKIDIDGIIDSSYIKNILENNHLFPTILLTERPDKASQALLEGKIIIIVDNSPYVLILPCFFIDFFHTTDDYYQKSIHTSFIRIIRLFSFLIAIYLPAFYISVTTRNYNLISFNLLLSLKASRSFVPFPIYLEAFIMIICFEILKESDLRMSSTTGSSISILGGLILGDAAVSAGIVSPIMIIIIAISSIASLIFSSIEFENALRVCKIIFILLSSVFGIFGIIIGTIWLLFSLINTKLFNYKYLTIDKNELLDSFIRIKTNTRKRNSHLTNNIIGGKYE